MRKPSMRKPKLELIDERAARLALALRRLHAALERERLALFGEADPWIQLQAMDLEKWMIEYPDFETEIERLVQGGGNAG